MQWTDHPPRRLENISVSKREKLEVFSTFYAPDLSPIVLILRFISIVIQSILSLHSKPNIYLSDISNENISLESI